MGGNLNSLVWLLAEEGRGERRRREERAAMAAV